MKPLVKDTYLFYLVPYKLEFSTSSSKVLLSVMTNYYDLSRCFTDKDYYVMVMSSIIGHPHEELKALRPKIKRSKNGKA